MALLTQKVILDTFGQMLNEMSFDKITVSMLVKRCGVSSNTFYYHYQDIYALLNVWLTKRVDDIRSNCNANGDWKAETAAILRACKDNLKTVEHIFNSFSREQIENYIFSHSDGIFTEYVKQKTSAFVITEEQISQIATFCRYAFIGMFLHANWCHFNFNIEEKVDSLSILFDSFIITAANNIKDSSQV